MTSTNWTSQSIGSTTYGPQTSFLYNDSTRAYDTAVAGFGTAVDYYDGALPIGPEGLSTNYVDA